MQAYLLKGDRSTVPLIRGYGARIRLVRTQLGFAAPNGNQSDFAKLVFSTQGTVSDWEREVHTPPIGSLRLVAALCEDDDKVFQWLLTGKEMPPIRRKLRR